MNQQQVAKLLLVIAARYPTSRLLEQDEALTVQAWHMTLSDVPYEAAEKALADWFRTEKWAPDPSELRNAVAGQLLGLPEVEEAWSYARSAMARYYPHYPAPDLSDIPRPVRRAIDAAGGLHALVTSTRMDRDREVFLKAYAVERKREVEMTALDRIAIREPAMEALT